MKKDNEKARRRVAAAKERRIRCRDLDIRPKKTGTEAHQASDALNSYYCFVTGVRISITF
jgi:hypothetical protein